MYIKKQKSKKLLVTSSLILVAATLTAAFAFYSSSKESHQNKQVAVGASEEKTSDTIKKNTDITSSKSSGLPSNSNQVTTNDVPPSSTLNIMINSFYQKDGYVTSNAQTSGPGTCVFEYTTEGDKPVVDQLSVLDGECQSSLPELQFAKLGTWKLKVTYYNNGQKAQVEKDVTIN
jgi:hypothetical protein